MASLVATHVKDDRLLELSGIITPPGHSACGKDWGEIVGIGKTGIVVEDRLENIIDKCDVVVDFTNPDASIKSLSICKSYKKPIVIGTTGFSEKQISMIEDYSKTIPVIFSPNMALGVNLLFELVKQVSSVLDDNYDIEIIETHHRYKKDSPSGTANKIAEVIARERGIKLEERAVYARFGNTGPRKEGEIGIHAVRAGNINGEHTIIFNSLGERLELTHKAYGREAFAEGTIKAIHFILGKLAGLYTMKDVLNL
jgi:4-hydroxy-tetrahydrodipicolinate reductase